MLSFFPIRLCYLLVVICGFFATASAGESPVSESLNLQKVYTTPDRLVVQDSELLYLLSEDEAASVSGIYQDSAGIYILVPSPDCWYCPPCDRNHWGVCPRDLCR